MGTPHYDRGGNCSCGTNAHHDTAQCARNRATTQAYMASLLADDPYAVTRARILPGLPRLPDGWDSVAHSHAGSCVVLRSRRYRETGHGEYIVLWSGTAEYDIMLPVSPHEEGF